MTPDEVSARFQELADQQELTRLREENAKLMARIQSQASRGLTLRVSEKGGLSIFGLQRFPVTLYKSQWLRLLAMTDELHAFIAENDAHLREKS